MPRAHVLFKMACLIPVIASQACQNLGSMPCCREARRVNLIDDGVHSIEEGSCVFNNTLCSYTQACADSTMSNWTKHEGYARAYQLRTDYSNDRTILSSVLLDFSQDTCFFAAYALPANSFADLDGFLEYNSSGTDDVYQLIQGKMKWVPSDLTEHAKVPIRHNASFPSGRVKIRAKAGGANKEVHLLFVSIKKGRCESPSCDFDGGFCDWTPSGWSRTSQLGSGTSSVRDHDDTGQFAYLHALNGSLTTPLTRAPGDLGDCVRFQYVLSRAGSSLSVSVRVLGGSVITPWTLTFSESSSRRWKVGALRVQTSHAYQIIFSGHRANLDTAIVALDFVNVTALTPATSCGLEPPEAGSGDSSFPTVPTVAPTSEYRTSHTAFPGTVSSVGPGTSEDKGSTPGEVTGSQPLSSTRSSLGDDGSSSTAAAIGGSVAAIIVIGAIGVTVVIVVCRRRRIHGKRQNQGAGSQTFASKEGGDARQIPLDNSDSYYSEIRLSHFLRPRSENGNTDVDGLPLQHDVTVPKDDVSPYEVPDDEGVRKPDNSRYVNVQGSSHPAAVVRAAKPGDDGYSHVNTFQHPSQTNVNSNNDDYNHIGDRSSSPKPRPTKGGEVKVASKEKSRVPVSQGYSLVRARNQTPGQLLKTSEQEDEYNIISRDAPRAKHVLDDTYNRLGSTSTRLLDDRNGDYSLASRVPDVPNHAVNSAGSLEQSAESDGFNTGGGDADYYILQERVQDDPDEYNTLDIDGSRKQSAMTGKEKARQPYDHVRSDPDDGYCKTRIGKRNIVIDSDYDHVKH